MMIEEKISFIFLLLQSYLINVLILLFRTSFYILTSGLKLLNSSLLLSTDDFSHLLITRALLELLIILLLWIKVGVARVLLLIIPHLNRCILKASFRFIDLRMIVRSYVVEIIIFVSIELLLIRIIKLWISCWRDCWVPAWANYSIFNLKYQTVAYWKLLQILLVVMKLLEW